MIHLIEPCCAQRHLLAVRNAIRDNGTAQIEGYGDMSLAELLGPMLTRYGETEMMIVAPTLPGQAAEAIGRWMRRQWARMDGRGRMDVIRHLTVVARPEEDASGVVASWLADRPFGDRLTLIDAAQEDTAILLPDFAVTGPVNMRYGRHFTAEATTEPEKVRALWEKYTRLAEEHAGDKAADPAADGAGGPAADPVEGPAKPARKKASRKRKRA